MVKMWPMSVMNEVRSRRRTIQNDVLLVLLFAAAPALVRSRAASSPKNAETKGKRLTADYMEHSAIVIDGHADTPQRFLDERFDLGNPLNGGNFNLESARKGGLSAEFFAIWVEPARYKGRYAHRTLELIDAVKQQVAKHSDEMELATSTEGIERAHAQHKFAALMGIEAGTRSRTRSGCCGSTTRWACAT